jgi:hypothetical protein
MIVNSVVVSVSEGSSIKIGPQLRAVASVRDIGRGLVLSQTRRCLFLHTAKHAHVVLVAPGPRPRIVVVVIVRNI